MKKYLLLLLVLVLSLIPVSVFSQAIDTTMVATSLNEEVFRLYGDNENECYLEFELPDSSDYYVTYQAYGEAYDGAPNLIVSVNGQQSYQTNVLEAWVTFSHQIFGDKVRFSFTNDKWEPGVGDRNLYLRGFIFDNVDRDTLYMEEIRGWDFKIYKCIDDSISGVSMDTLTIGDTLNVSFLQPMWESSRESQPDPETCPFEHLVDDFFVFKNGTTSNQNNDSLFVTYKHGADILLERGVYASTISCMDIHENSSKYSNWRLFYVEDMKWVPFVPVYLKINTKRKD